MLPLRQQVSRYFGAYSFACAIIVNASLVGLIYGLTMGSAEQQSQDAIKIDFRQFTDSQVEEQQTTPDLEVTPEPVPEMTLQPQVIQPNFSVPNISANSPIKLAALSAPTFSVIPEFSNITSDIQPQAITTIPKIGFAKVLRRTNPQYPYKARRSHVEGYVLLHVLIDDAGDPVEIKIIEEKPRGYFAKVTRRAVNRWKFEKSPAGTSVWKKWRMVFELN